MTLGQLTLSALVGLMAAFLASRLVTEHGYGVVGDIVVGVSGAMIGAVVLGAFITRGVLAPLGIVGGSPVAQIIVPLIGGRRPAGRTPRGSDVPVGGRCRVGCRGRQGTRRWSGNRRPGAWYRRIVTRSDLGF